MAFQRLRLLSGLLVSACVLACPDGLWVGPNCELASPCFVGSPSLAGVGACVWGAVTCGPAGEEVCVGFGTPSAEICNGLDDDCDGRTDEKSDMLDSRLGVICGPVGLFPLCQPGLTFCSSSGEVLCHGAIIPQEELCNRRDDNCNGIVDDVPLGPLCYSGAPGTQQNPPCHPGVTVCRDGTWTCENEWTPTVEVCDALLVDEDCDGQRNEGFELQPADVLLIRDRSCSMALGQGQGLNATRDGVRQFLSSTSSDADFRYAVIDVALAYDEPFRLRTDFTDSAQLVQLLMEVTGHGGDEPTLDVLAAVAVDGVVPLTWRSGVQGYVALFQDEEAQSHRPVSRDLVELEVAEALRQRGLILLAFVDEPWSVDAIVQATGGLLAPLKIADIAKGLVKTVGAVCR